MGMPGFDRVLKYNRFARVIYETYQIKINANEIENSSTTIVSLHPVFAKAFARRVAAPIAA